MNQRVDECRGDYAWNAELEEGTVVKRSYITDEYSVIVIEEFEEDNWRAKLGLCHRERDIWILCTRIVDPR